MDLGDTVGVAGFWVHGAHTSFGICRAITARRGISTAAVLALCVSMIGCSNEGAEAADDLDLGKVDMGIDEAGTYQSAAVVMDVGVGGQLVQQPLAVVGEIV